MGLLYLIQPVELCGTNRYKIGCSSKNTLERVLSYKKGSRYLITITTEMYKEIEQILIEQFNNKFICIGGREYFEGNENDMFNIFLDIIKKHNKIPQQELIEHNNEENVEQTTNLQDNEYEHWKDLSEEECIERLKENGIEIEENDIGRSFIRCCFCGALVGIKNFFAHLNRITPCHKGQDMTITSIKNYCEIIKNFKNDPNYIKLNGNYYDSD